MASVFYIKRINNAERSANFWQLQTAMFTNRYGPVISKPYYSYAHQCIADVANARTSGISYNDNLMSLGRKTYYKNDTFLLITSMRETPLYTPSFQALVMGSLLLWRHNHSVKFGWRNLFFVVSKHKISEKLWHLITLVGELNAFFLLLISRRLSHDSIQFYRKFTYQA